MRPPPPPRTLFPYTTLFRSPQIYLEVDILQFRTQELICCFRYARTMATAVVAITVDIATAVGIVAVVGTLVDRKSTRLNSSHPSISYAVFCLKKKRTSCCVC